MSETVLAREPEAAEPSSSSLGDLIDRKTARIGICGLGYVGLPLAMAASEAGFRVTGFDIDVAKVRQLEAGKSYIPAVSDSQVSTSTKLNRFGATFDFARLSACDVICICVPTPLTPQREPDLTIVRETAATIAQHIRRDQLVILESTTYPGTTTLVVKPILETSGLEAGVDLFLAYSPEREDPGSHFRTVDIPKVVAGDGPIARDLVMRFYGSFLNRVVPVSTTEVAEVVKLTENIFRFVNIGLVNELKRIYDAMGIDIWEVIEAAKTKPFGFMPFYPGPGLGGHCIPVDPFYLTWRSREFDLPTRFVELAGEVNQGIPYYVVSKLEESLDQIQRRSLSTSRVLLVGVAYKKNVSDTRESPGLKLFELLAKRCCHVAFYDPHVASLRVRDHETGKDEVISSEAFTRENLLTYNAAIVVTDHDAIDYGLLLASSHLIVDTRNAMGYRGFSGPKVIKA